MYNMPIRGPLCSSGCVCVPLQNSTPPTIARTQSPVCPFGSIGSPDSVCVYAQVRAREYVYERVQMTTFEVRSEVLLWFGHRNTHSASPSNPFPPHPSHPAALETTSPTSVRPSTCKLFLTEHTHPSSSIATTPWFLALSFFLA